MALNNARELCYEEVRFQDKPALFTSLRVSRDSVPEGLHRYEIRYDEDTCEPCQLARGILVNHYGTILTAEPIALPEDGYLGFEPDELDFEGRACCAVENFQEKILSRKNRCPGTTRGAVGGPYAEKEIIGCGDARPAAACHGKYPGRHQLVDRIGCQPR